MVVLFDDMCVLLQNANSGYLFAARTACFLRVYLKKILFGLVLHTSLFHLVFKAIFELVSSILMGFPMDKFLTGI